MPVNLQHQSNLMHHVSQGTAWLAESAEGENSAALSYAALEFRFGIEKLAAYYWATLLNRKLEIRDLEDIRSFRKIENRIYELAGHQKEINAHFDFMRVLMDACKIDLPLVTPKIGSLTRFWHECSEFCHVGFSLACTGPEIKKAAFSSLSKVAETLPMYVRSLGWPVLHEREFVELRERFVRGNASAQDVLEHIQRVGLHALITYPGTADKRPIGEAVEPAP